MSLTIKTSAHILIMVMGQDELPMLEWHEILDRLVKVQETVKLCLVKDHLDPLDITNRIMRKDNYMISMVNTGVFKVETWFFGEHSGVFGSTLEWNLRFCVLDSMFDEKFSVKAFLDPVSNGSSGPHDSYGPPDDALQIRNGALRLKRRFIIMGVVNFVFMPFIAIFMVIYFLLKHFEEVHSKSSSLGPREWTSYARWHLREYNELPHFFERRLKASVGPAQNYMNQFPYNLSKILAQSVAYISGAVVGVLLILSLTGSRSVLNVYVGDRSLIWYLAVFTAILAISRSMIPDSVDKHNPPQAMAEVIKHTHYCPIDWRHRFHEQYVRKNFGKLFRPTILVFLGEIFSVVSTPFVLCFYLPSKVEAILRCVKQLTVDLEGVGDVCGPAAFDIEKFSRLPLQKRHSRHDETRDDKTNRRADRKSESDANAANRVRKYAEAQMPFADEAEMEDQYLEPFKPNQAKLEKSFVSFLCNHPNYETRDKSGARFLTALNAESVRPSHPNNITRRPSGELDTGGLREINVVHPEEKSDLKKNATEQPSRAHRPQFGLGLGPVASQLYRSNVLDDSQHLSESDLALQCSFSQILKNSANGGFRGGNRASILMKPKLSLHIERLDAVREHEQTRLFEALDSVYENASRIESKQMGLAESVAAEMKPFRSQHQNR
mmetsp:Transcript_28386/g.39495  ORF Transcript_28386/g.39495 Transcript_28386/m.39495 type:complete len:664 (+) Transcript_28386:71-2062(+)